MLKMKQTGMSLGAKLEAAGGRPTGFDYMRLVLAVLVVAAHSGVTAYGRDHVGMWDSPLGGLFRCVLPMFFALSGFLVAGSLDRCKTLISFLGLRVVRIYPALTVEVILSAFLIGPLMTTLSLGDYFANPTFHRYLWNVLGHIHYELPGVFASNPWPNMINGQLWTVPFELICYGALSGLIMVGARRHRIIVPLGAVACAVAYAAISAMRHDGALPVDAGPIGGALLIVTFLAGVAIYLYRNALPWNHGLGLASGLASIWLMRYVPHGQFLGVFTLSYLTIYLGLFSPRKIYLLRGADYSYGIFLYGFVIQQLVMALLPGAREWYWNILICVPLSAAFAGLSWHMVEKPALKLRHKVNALEAVYLKAFPAKPKPAAVSSGSVAQAAD